MKWDDVGMASRINQYRSVVSSIVLIFVITSLLSAGRAHAQCQYDVTIIQAPECPPFGAQPTVGTAINDQGHVVGYYDVCLGDIQRAFLWTPEGGMQTLAMPDGVLSARAYDINDAGQIVGTMGGFVSPPRGFLYENGEVIDLGTLPGGNWSEALGMNNAAQVVGYSGNIVTGDPPLQAFIWEDGVMIDLGPSLNAVSSRGYDINDSGQVTGWGREEADGERIAFIWENGDVTDLGPIPGGFSSEGRGINNLGEVAGHGRSVLDESGIVVTRAFLWMDGKMEEIGMLPGFDRCAAVDVNDPGEVIGGCDQLKNPNNDHPFIWQHGVMTDLNHLIAPDSGILFTIANAINDVGQITGQARLDWNDVAVVLTPPALEIGDLNRDFAVDAFDLALLLGSWGPCPQDEDCLADLNDDGSVGPFDLAELLGHWLPCPEYVSTGGCRFCDPDGVASCEILTGEECEAAGGTYFGDESYCYACFADACDPIDEACCEIVCAVDPFCCEEGWDEICVVLEKELCE